MTPRIQTTDSDTPPPFITEIHRGDSIYLGIRVAPSKSGLHKTFGKPGKMKGAKFTDAGIEEWRWSGVQEDGGWLYLTFPMHTLPEKSGLHPFSEAFAGSPPHALQMLQKMRTALEISGSGWNSTPGAALLSGAFYDDEKNLYFLSPTAAEILHQERELSHLPRGLSSNREFSYGVLRNFYHCLQIKYVPASSTTETPFARVHPHVLLPRLHPKIANVLNDALVKENPPTTEELWKYIEQWSSLEPMENLNPRDLSERVEAAKKETRKSQRRQQNRLFRKKHGSSLLLTLAAVAVLAFFSTPFIRNALEPDATEGLGPEEVVSLFYESWNTLDHEVMQDCVEKGAGKEQINQVTTLFVISRIRQGMERKEVFTGAPEWIEAGKPPVQGSNYIFGATDLKVTPVDQQQDSAFFEADYIQWTTLPPEAANVTDEKARLQVESTGQVEAFRMKVRIELRNTRKGWKIVSFEELRRQPYRYEAGQS